MKPLSLTKTYTPYDRYTDSGVAWLGQMPEGWQYMKLKHVAKIMGGFAFSSDDYTDKGVLLIRIGEVKNEIDISKAKYLPSEHITKYRQFIVRKNDILIAMTGYVGQTSMYPLEKNGLLNQRVGLMREFDNCNHDFLYYLTQIESFKTFLSLNSKSSAQENVSETDIGKFSFAIPPLPTQQRIATYLDEKTEKIDRIIAGKKRLVELLEEKRKSVISEAVSSEKLKVKSEKLKFLAPLRNQKVAVKKENETYLALENIKSWKGTLLNVSDTQVFESIVNVFKKDDVLFGKLRPYLAKVHLAKFDGVCTGELLALVPKKNKINPKYLFYKTIDEKFIDLVNNSTFGAKMPRASWDFIGNIEIEYPSLEIQREITERLDEQLSKIDDVIKKVKQSIHLLTEYKSSLISHVVTGRVKV